MKSMTKLVIGAVLATAMSVAYAKEPPPAPAKPATPSKPATPPAPGGKAAPTTPAAKTPTPPTTPPAAMPTMAPPKPGAETLALAPMASNVTWTGKMMADAMMPGQPEMPTKGSASCKWVLGKLWIQCTIKATTGVGKDAMKMEGVMLLGWDFEAKEYRANWTDTMGSSGYMRGKLEGTKFWLESLGEYTMMGQPAKWRYTWDWTDPKAATLTMEGAMGKGGKWKVMEVSNLKGLKAPKPAKTP